MKIVVLFTFFGFACSIYLLHLCITKTYSVLYQSNTKIHIASCVLYVYNTPNCIPDLEKKFHQASKDELSWTPTMVGWNRTISRREAKEMWVEEIYTDGKIMLIACLHHTTSARNRYTVAPFCVSPLSQPDDAPKPTAEGPWKVWGSLGCPKF